MFHWLRSKGKHAPDALPQQSTDWVILFASQRGRAKKLAEHTAQTLQSVDKTVELKPLAEITPDQLSQYHRVLLITSTFGSGQSPESARKFEKKLNKTTLDLSQLQFAILALGDKNYDRFCGFGRKFNQWLLNQNARPLNEIILVDQMNAQQLANWQAFIENLCDQQ